MSYSFSAASAPAQKIPPSSSGAPPRPTGRTRMLLQRLLQQTAITEPGPNYRGGGSNRRRHSTGSRCTGPGPGPELTSAGDLLVDVSALALCRMSYENWRYESRNHCHCSHSRNHIAPHPTMAHLLWQDAHNHCPPHALPTKVPTHAWVRVVADLVPALGPGQGRPHSWGRLVHAMARYPQSTHSKLEATRLVSVTHPSACSRPIA